MNPNDTSAQPDTPGMDRREFLRVSGALAAGGALMSAGCQVPQEATVPFHDMPESLVDGIGPARFFHTVIDGSPVLVKTREGRPILVAPSPTDASGRALTVRHQAALMDLYDPDRARGPLSVRRGNGPPVASSWAATGADVVSRLKAAGTKAVLLTGPVGSPALAAAIAAITSRTGARHVVWSPIESDANAVMSTDPVAVLAGIASVSVKTTESGSEGLRPVLHGRDDAIEVAPDGGWQNDFPYRGRIRDRESFVSLGSSRDPGA